MLPFEASGIAALVYKWFCDSKSGSVVSGGELELCRTQSTFQTVK